MPHEESFNLIALTLPCDLDRELGPIFTITKVTLPGELGCLLTTLVMEYISL
jgi:hypothetical protein